MTLKKRAFENIVGKRENADNQHFLLFPPCFLPYLREKPSFQQHLSCRLQMLSIWMSPKFWGYQEKFIDVGRETSLAYIPRLSKLNFNAKDAYQTNDNHKSLP